MSLQVVAPPLPSSRASTTSTRTVEDCTFSTTSVSWLCHAMPTPGVPLCIVHVWASKQAEAETEGWTASFTPEKGVKLCAPLRVLCLVMRSSIPPSPFACTP